VALITLTLQGELYNQFPDYPSQLEIETPREAIAALSSQIEGFHEFLVVQAESGVCWRVVVNDRPLPAEEINWKLPEGAVLTIAPEIHFGGDIWNAIVGAGLFAVSLFVPGALGATLSYLGGGLLTRWLGGLFPQPDRGRKEEGSFSFGSLGDDRVQGQIVPIAYGEVWYPLTAVVSGRIDTIDTPITNAPNSQPIVFAPPVPLAAGFLSSLTFRSFSTGLAIDTKWQTGNNYGIFLELWDGISLRRLYYSNVVAIYLPDVGLNGSRASITNIQEMDRNRNILNAFTPPINSFLEYYGS
jgi:predicted phage tail protein